MIADEVLKSGVDNVGRMVVHINPQTLNAKAFIDQGNNEWEPFKMWEWKPKED